MNKCHQGKVNEYEAENTQGSGSVGRGLSVGVSKECEERGQEARCGLGKGSPHRRNSRCRASEGLSGGR